MENETQSSRKIWIYMTIISRFITDFETDASVLIDAVVFANKGQLYPRLITHGNIRKIVRIIKETESNYDRVIYQLR